MKHSIYILGQLSLSNQIYLVTFMCLTVDTSFIFTKKSNVAKWYLKHWDSTVLPKFRRQLSSKSKLKLSKNVALNWYSSMIKNLERFRHFLTYKINFECPNFWRTLCHLSITDTYKKKTFCNIWLFCKNEACVNPETHKRH